MFGQVDLMDGVAVLAEELDVVRRGQVELLGGGLYNPLSPLISTVI